MIKTFKKQVKLDAYKYAYIFVMFILFASCFSPVSRGEMSIKDILPQEELDYITHNMQDGHTCLYTIALLNPEDKFIQIIPVTIKVK